MRWQHGSGNAGCRRASLVYFFDRLPGEAHPTVVAAVVFARHVWPSGAPPVQRSAARGGDWNYACSSADGWAGLSFARGVLGANEYEFDLPDRSRTLVGMADVKNGVAARAITVPRMTADAFIEHWLQVRILVGLLRSAFGGSPFVSRSEAWAEEVCALPAVDQFLEACAARAR
ncbi:hypothetical protein [Gemmatimonas sp.]|uniref:hypothetical protein n=1 Tax=Gemmatimonas sp. TaxID=1962908 RepID=UPI00286E5970|nr:hypothetical protein [Gemmatimonas sp.]